MSLDGFVQLIFNVYEAYTVALFLRRGDHLSCFSAITFAKSFDKSRLLSLDGTLAGWAVKHREPLIIGNFDKDEETLGYYGKREEIKSFMAYPLEIPGVIVVDSKKKWVFTDKEKKLLAHFVAVASKEVEREKQLKEMEEEREEVSLLRRQLKFFRQPRMTGDRMEEAIKEALLVSGGDMAVAAVEKRGRLSIVSAVGEGAANLLGAVCPMQNTVASTVMEGKEFLLPYESGYLREKTLFFPNDGVRAKQYFGFPLAVDDRSFGFLGFVSLFSRPLRERAIIALRDTAVLASLSFSRLQAQEELEAQSQKDPATGAMGFAIFFDFIEKMAKQRKSFSLISVKLPGFTNINKTLGARQADDLLKKMRQAVEYGAGKNAMATRSGGAHFYAALAGSDGSEESRNILNILKVGVLNALPIPTSGLKKELEIGTAHFPRDGTDLWELIGIAGDRAKRNRT